MKKIHKWVLMLVLTLLYSFPAWAGSLTDKGFIYKPGVGARGVSEKNAFDAGMDRVDARLGKEIWVGDPNYGVTLPDAVTAVGSSYVTLRVPAGTYSISADLTIPANINLRVDRGATLSVATTKTLTINGKLEAGLYRIFACAGTGKVVLGTGSVKEVQANWFTTYTDGSADVAAEIQLAINSVASHIPVRFNGIFRVDSPLTIDGKGSLKLLGNSTYFMDRGTQFYCKNLTDYLFTASTWDTNNTFSIDGIYFNGCNSQTIGGGYAGSTWKGLFKNSDLSGNTVFLNFKNLTIAFTNYSGACALDLSKTYYVNVENVRIMGFYNGRAFKLDTGTTCLFTNCHFIYFQEIGRITDQYAVAFRNCNFSSSSVALAAADAAIRFDSCWFEGLGYQNLTGISYKQVSHTIAGYDVPVDTFFNFVNVAANFNNCNWSNRSWYTNLASGVFRLISHNTGSYPYRGMLELNKCSGSNIQSISPYNVYPLFNKNNINSNYLIKVVEGDPLGNEGLVKLSQDIRQVDYGEMCARSGLTPLAGRMEGGKWLLPMNLTDAAFYTTPMEILPYTSYQGNDINDGWRVGDRQVSPNYDAGNNEGWTIVRENRTTTTATFTSTDTTLTVASTAGMVAGDSIRVLTPGYVPTTYRTIVSVDSGTGLTLSGTLGQTVTTTGYLVQAWKWMPYGQRGYRTTSASPSGSLTPKFVGEEVLDTTNNKWYKSYGTANTHWAALN